MATQVLTLAPCSMYLEILEQPLILSESPRRTTIAGIPLQHLTHKFQEVDLLLPLKTSLSVLEWNVVWPLDFSGEIT